MGKPLKHRRKDSDDSFNTESEHSEDNSGGSDSFKSDKEEEVHEEDDDEFFDGDKGVADTIELGEGQKYSM